MIQMKKTLVAIMLMLVLVSVYLFIAGRDRNFVTVNRLWIGEGFLRFGKKITVEKVVIDSDKDGDGIPDLDDIVQGARQEAQNKTRYRDAYYENGGYPPPDEGVCTDVIWRAFRNAGYDLKKMIDDDIKRNLRYYPRIWGQREDPDPNIDFRRVQNLISFFKRHAEILTTEIKPWDAENLKQWQGGDIVTFDGPHPLEHIGIISDIRRADGVPLLIHNGGPYAKEEDRLLSWHEDVSKITYHFRFPKQ